MIKVTVKYYVDKYNHQIHLNKTLKQDLYAFWVVIFLRFVSVERGCSIRPGYYCTRKQKSAKVVQQYL